MLGEQFDRVRSGSGAVLLIEGEAGMGKSRLIGEGVTMARRRSFPIGIGAAEPSESVAELAPLLRALFDGPEPLLDRAGLSGLHAAPEQRYWRLQDLQSLLERAAMDSPLLIFLDDVQWADSGTVAALRALPPGLASLPIGWILAMRSDQGSGQLRSAVEYLADEGAERLVLEPLSQAAVAEMASDVMQAEPDEALLEMAGEAGGNPFLLVELLEGLREEELVRVDSGRATLADSRLPDRVGTSMRERLARMSESPRQVATVAGSLGRTFSISELAEMLGLVPASLLTPVEQLIEAGIVRERGDQLCFQHDLIREAVRHACCAVSPPRARSASRRRHACQGRAAPRRRDSACCQRRARGRGRHHHAPNGRPGTGDDRSGSERRPQPAGSGADPREAFFARSARRASRDVAARGGTDRGGKGFRG